MTSLPWYRRLALWRVGKIQSERKDELTIDMDPKKMDDLAKIHIRMNLDDKSIEKFNELLTSGESVEAAAYHAIINHQIRIALTIEIEKEETKRLYYDQEPLMKED